MLHCYYTPQYIVDYIVQNTVGQLLEQCCAPEDVTRIKLLDPACGSGSFLLGAYQALIDWHKNYYAQKSHWDKKDREAAYHNGEGQVRLTAQLKRQILLNNIFGVDIDPQAVEVTRFSLSLKALEETRRGELYEEVNLFKQTVLPDLRDNIKCGNSLIGNDYSMLPTERVGVSAFEWPYEFPSVMAEGGFDAVIGNPPWGADIHKEQRGYLSTRFPDVADFESAQYFLMHGIALLNEAGLLGMIIPNTFALNVYARKTRQKIIELTSVTAMADLSSEKVFEGPSVRSMLIFLSREKQAACRVIEFHKDIDSRLLQTVSVNELMQAETWKEFLATETPLSKLASRLAKNNPSLADYCDVRQGYIPYRTTTLTRRFGQAQAKEIVKGRSWHSNERKSQDYQKELQGADVGRYVLDWSGVWVKYGEWVSTYLPISVFSGPRVLIREIAGRPPHVLLAAYAEDVFIHNPSVLAVLPRGPVSAKFILGVLNSRLMSLIFSSVAPKAQKGLFPKIIITDARRLPVPKINLELAQDKARHDRIVEWVTAMLDLRQLEAKTKTQSEQQNYQRQINATDREIDALVYELYGLTQSEIAVIESQT